MSELKETIIALQAQSKALEPDESVRNNYVSKVHDYANQFLNSLSHAPAYNSSNETQGIFQVNGNKKSITEILDIYTAEVAQKGINAASGSHLGYIPGGGIYTSALADYIADVTNEYAGMYYASPGAVAMENELLNWLKSIFGFPESAIGNLTSGGSIANLIALAAARDKYSVTAQRIPKSVIYVSNQVHHCINKALRIIGLVEVIVRHVDLDEASRINPDDLEQKVKSDLANGLFPFLVIASAGTTDTGAIDPLEPIAKIAKAYNLWYHIDAAYGGFFVLTEEKRTLLKGMALADSLVVDPHKGLFLPYGIGAVLVKDKEAVYHSNHYRANYMQDTLNDDSPINPADVSPELTKHFRGFRMWLPLQLHGIEPFVACLREKLLLAAYFRAELLKLGFMLGPEPDLTVSYFWYSTGNDQENEFNEHLMKEIHNDGEVFLSSTKISGKFVIRIAVLSFRTKLETIDRAIKMIDKALTKVKAVF
ncbi:pyridoxal phosphate-dependent decarboxylase family protein [Geojedonia litorea]|uniref:Pyridoxal phosphate-dependent decarboxylase family protein n=1 Tax=Geojedonia litorea TaxID=1268269 RepID=A0ABV9N235_9FLAO